MTPKQHKFALEYLVDCNATQAAKRAGYSERTAPQQGGRLLKKAQVAEVIRAAQSKAAADAEVTLDWLISELRENHRIALDGAPAMDRYGNPTGHVVRQIAASNKSLELLAKLTGHMVERRENTQKSLNDLNEAELRSELAKEMEKQSKLVH